MALVQLSDAEYTPPARPGPLASLFLPYLNDPRDLPFVRLSLVTAAVLIPFAAYLYWPGKFRWWLGAIYFAAMFHFFMDRCILMLHNTSHRPLFKRRYRWLNRFIPWVISPFFGETPETYFVHHVGMHHPENNQRTDVSSTMAFKRDSLRHWLRYYAGFMITGFPKLARYLKRHRRTKLLRQVLLGEGWWVVMVILLGIVNWRTTLVVFVFPVLLVRVLMMIGNWAQHAFIDPEHVADPYRNAIACVNTRYNRRCFNDGYHIGHHVKPTRHWTEMPEELRDNLATYAAHDALVFDGLDYFQIWLLLMRKRFDLLADHVVDIGDTGRNRAEWAQLLRARTRPCV